MAIIPDEIIDAMPRDPVAGLRYLHEYLYGRIERAEDEESYEARATDYVMGITVYLESNEKIAIKVPDSVNLPSMQRIVERYLLKDSFERHRSLEAATVAKLEPNEKKAIHTLIAGIRELIEQSELTDRKRNTLFARLNDLAAEVDRTATRFDNLMGATIEVATVLGEAGERAKPIVDRLREIMMIGVRAKARDEKVQLTDEAQELSLIEDLTDHADKD